MVDVLRLPPGVLVSSPHRPELTFLRWGEQIPVHVVGEADARNRGQDRVAVAEGIREPFQDEDRGPFADHEAVRLRIEVFAETFALRGYDSVQLAAACEILSAAPGEVAFSCFDNRLNKAARVLGLDVT